MMKTLAEYVDMTQIRGTKYRVGKKSKKMMTIQILGKEIRLDPFGGGK